jgi:hypothetical protein
MHTFSLKYFLVLNAASLSQSSLRPHSVRLSLSSHLLSTTSIISNPNQPKYR